MTQKCLTMVLDFLTLPCLVSDMLCDSLFATFLAFQIGLFSILLFSNCFCVYVLAVPVLTSPCCALDTVLGLTRGPALLSC